MTKPRWSPAKTTIVTVVLVFVVGMVIACVLGVVTGGDPERAGYRVGRALGPIMILAGIIAYVVQHGRVANDK